MEGKRLKIINIFSIIEIIRSFAPNKNMMRKNMKKNNEIKT
ncbi:hypothetical protein VO54_03297 [Elizabethkingia miricola]|nr:hypothetical protein VO54_03297 [Elizabethkingia miricola]